MPARLGRQDSPPDLVEAVAAGDAPEPERIDGVQADVEPPDARVPDGVEVPIELHAVGGERHVGQARHGGQAR